MKRMISLTLSVLLIFALTACGGQSGGATQDTGSTAAAGDTGTSPDSSPSTDEAADKAPANEAPVDQGGSSDDIYELTIIEPNYSGNNELRLVDEYMTRHVSAYKIRLTINVSTPYGIKAEDFP